MWNILMWFMLFANGGMALANFALGSMGVGAFNSAVFLGLGLTMYFCRAAPIKTRNANAKLVTAAPKLYAALERCRLGFVTALADRPIRDVDEILRETDAALRAARGETSGED